MARGRPQANEIPLCFDRQRESDGTDKHWGHHRPPDGIPQQAGEHCANMQEMKALSFNLKLRTDRLRQSAHVQCKQGGPAASA